MAELTTVAAVKTYLGIASGVTTWDTLLAALLDQAESAIRNLCNRPNGWTKGTQTETLSGEDSDSIVLKYVPIDTNASFSITVDGDAVASTSYKYDPNNGVLKLLSSETSWWAYGKTFAPAGKGAAPGFRGDYRNIVASYTGGYTTMPGDLIYAAVELTAQLFRQRERDPALQSETLDKYSYTVNPNGATLPDAWATRLKPYIRDSLV